MDKRSKVIESIQKHKREIKRLKKKLSSMATDKQNQIYLIKPSNYPGVVKIGRTNRPVMSRISGYAKGSELLFAMTCDDCAELERNILVDFRSTFKARKDIGREFFEGDVKQMMDIIISRLTKPAAIKEEDEINEVVKAVDGIQIIECSDEGDWFL
jgi:hypothetical protein